MLLQISLCNFLMDCWDLQEAEKNAPQEEVRIGFHSRASAA